MHRVKLRKLIWSTWRRYGAGTFILIIIASCCLFLGVFLSANMGSEKNGPYELQAAAERIEDDTIALIAEFEDITSVTPIIDVPFSVVLNDITIETPLQGIQTGYLNFPFLYGSEFDSSSAMPYVILNVAAAESLIGEHEDISLPSLISRQVLLKSETETVTARISGVFDDEEETTKAYISLSSAKNLLLQSGVTPVYSMVYVRCLNAGKTESVTNFLSEQGLMVQNMNTELEAKWEIDSVHIAHLFITSVVLAFSIALLMPERKKIDPLYNGEEGTVLMSIGFSGSDLPKLNKGREAVFVCSALIVGFLLCIAIKDNLILR